MIATRHLPGIAIVLAIACVPTVRHTYIGSTVGDGRKLETIPLRLAGLEGRPSGRSATWVEQEYGTSEFIERQYGPSLTLFVCRSYDGKALYHHPELGVAHGESYERAVIVRTTGRPDVPVFKLRGSENGMSLYALLYDGTFVAEPMRFQLRNAFELVVRPRALMTLFFVRQKSGSPPRSNAAETLLLAAIDSFASQPATPSP